MFNLEIIGIKFTSRNQYGDFYWMSHQKEYEKSLFLFNDNEEFHDTAQRGGGNAIMRMYNKYSKYEPPRSAGIPTGTMSDGGYGKFTPKIKNVIDNSFDEIIKLILKYKYETIYFSSELNGKLGTSIFEVNPKVIDYITNRIYSLSNNPIKIIHQLPNNKFNDIYEFDNVSDTESND